jgi:hypothetical protein
MTLSPMVAQQTHEGVDGQVAAWTRMHEASTLAEKAYLAMVTAWATAQARASFEHGQRSSSRRELAPLLRQPWSCRRHKFPRPYTSRLGWAPSRGWVPAKRSCRRKSMRVLWRSRMTSGSLAATVKAAPPCVRHRNAAESGDRVARQAREHRVYLMACKLAQ